MLLIFSVSEWKETSISIGNLVCRSHQTFPYVLIVIF